MRNLCGWILFALLLSAASGATAHQQPRSADLAKDIDRLVRAIEREPTNRENYAERLDTFWRWSNDYALAGFPIDPDVPSTVARIRDPGPASQIEAQDLADIDRWVAEFAYRERNPRAVGTLSTPQLSGFEVDAFHTLTVVYTVGERALQVGDGFVLGELTYGRGPLLQARDPQADHYVSIETDRAGARFAIEGYPIRGIFSGTMSRSVIMSGPASKVFFRLQEGRLQPGDRVTMRLGDQRLGSRGLGLIAPSVDALRFRVWLHLERELLLMAMPELEFQSVGGPVRGVRGFGPSIVGAGEPFEVTVRFEDAFRNLARGTMPGVSVLDGDRQLAELPAGDSGVVRVPLSLSDPGVYRLRVVASGLPAGTINPIVVEEKPSKRLYWGETHGHSGFSEGMGSIDGVYRFARDQARLDFMALTEHDYWMDDAEWEELRRAAIQYNAPGEFLAFLAYEWTVHARHGGHHNIIYRTPEGRKRVPRQEVQTLDELYEVLHAENDPEDLLLIPHAHNPGDWGLSDARSERFVEIVSLHGTFEWFGRKYLDEGFMVGFLGGSDDHMGHPGLRPLRRNPTSDNFGGLLGLYATEKTNDAVFDAMRSIRGYATNGNRAILRVMLNGAEMGQEIAAAPQANVTGTIHGTAPIEELVLWKNGRPALVRDFAETDDRTGLLEVRFWSDSYPRAKGALARQWRRWRGRVHIDGTAVVSASSPQNDNPFTEFVRSSSGVDEGSEVDFFLKTRGSYKSILLELGDAATGRLHLSGVKESPLEHEQFAPFEFELDLETLAGEPQRFDLPTEGYDDHVLVRWVRRPDQEDVVVSMVDQDPAEPGDYYYLRARQVDGGLVWSSPFRVR